MNDRQSITEAFLEHRRTLISYLAQRLLSPEDIDDILQETYMQAFEIEKKSEIQSPKSYLFTIARNIMSKRLQSQAKKMSYEISGLDMDIYPEEVSEPEDRVYYKSGLKCFMEAVESLPPQCRRVFLMRKMYALPHKKIAAKLNISMSTVERHITEAITRLSTRMKAEGFETLGRPSVAQKVEKR